MDDRPPPPVYTCPHSSPWRCYDGGGTGSQTHWHGTSGHHHPHVHAPDDEPDDPLGDAEPDATAEP